MWSVTEAHLMGWDVTKLSILCNYLCVPMKLKLSHLLKTAAALLLESFYQHKMSMHQVRDSRVTSPLPLLFSDHPP